ncbi:MAG: hypothetical protein LAP13_26855, partial [Acidobacteriia bacterium]|nr:hypothetical protein [Terriglobia bacterium]
TGQPLAADRHKKIVSGQDRYDRAALLGDMAIHHQRSRFPESQRCMESQKSGVIVLWSNI